MARQVTRQEAEFAYEVCGKRVLIGNYDNGNFYKVTKSIDGGSFEKHVKCFFNYYPDETLNFYIG